MIIARNVAYGIANRFWNYIPRRCKSKKEHWAKLRRRKIPTEKALEHFDDFYKKVFGVQWPSIRVALLSPHKYCAVVNNFGSSVETSSYLENRGAIDLRALFQTGEQINHQIIVENEDLAIKSDELGRAVENLAFTTQTKELRDLYPPDKEILPHGNINLTNSSREEPVLESWSGHRESLKVGRDNAQLEEERMVDSSVGLTSSALHEFIPATELKGLDGYVLESDHYRYYTGDVEFPVTIKKEFSINYPEQLKICMYERGNVTPFEQPKRGTTGVLNYYLMDGGSVLPVLALDIKPRDRVLDMCAAPGGKSLIILQTLLFDSLVCNDFTESRVKRIKSVLNQYVYDLPKWEGRIHVTNRDGRLIEEEIKYDKILVDVPCTTDRLSLREDDNNLFNVARMKERLQLPELQSELLKNALKLVAPGGSVVYSTCSLSPIQNDGVVHMALRKIWEETQIEIEVRDLAPALEATKPVFKFGEDIGLRYGHLVLPFLPLNFGPLYFCKLVRTK